LSSFIRTRNAGRLKVADKANPLARIGLDQDLILAGVAYGFPCSSDARAERRFRNDASVPYRSNQVVPAHDAITVLQKKKQEIENLGFHGDGFGVARELALVTVENAAGEDELHFDPLTLEQ
jgi:hypothetical protein